MQFYRCPWALYEEARPGSLRLLPPAHHLAELERDYRAMQVMLFGQIPSFDEIMKELAALEKAINELRVAGMTDRTSRDASGYHFSA